jgi:hypothetical protein
MSKHQESVGSLGGSLQKCAILEICGENNCANPLLSSGYGIML